jgi:hypothetical protein
VRVGRHEGTVDDAAVLAVGMGGYIGGRSLEKVAGVMTGSLAKAADALPQDRSRRQKG